MSSEHRNVKGSGKIYIWHGIALLFMEILYFKARGGRRSDCVFAPFDVSGGRSGFASIP